LATRSTVYGQSYKDPGAVELELELYVRHVIETFISPAAGVGLAHMMHRASTTVAAACTLLAALRLCCADEHQPPLNLTVNVSRVVGQLDVLSKFNDAKLPSVTRVLYTRRDVEAREYIRKLVVETGLLLREDPVGNIFARLPASDDSTASDEGAVGTGSHYDAIPYSGMYDGTVGVLGGLEAVRALRDSGFRPRRAIEVLAFTSEEPTRFGMSCIGSRLLVGQLAVSALRDLQDQDGISFDEARGEAGVVGNLSDVLLPENYYAAFVELHIEQGKVLEEGDYDIGTCPSRQQVPPVIAREISKSYLMFS
jgi:hypothetical protein